MPALTAFDEGLRSCPQRLTGHPNGGEIVLGRGADDVVELDSPTVSRHHARIVSANR